MTGELVNSETQKFLRKFSSAFQKVYPDFDKSTYLKDTFDSKWPKMPVEQRLSYLSASLKKSLPDDYSSAISIIIDLLAYLQKSPDYSPWVYMFLPDYMVRYGMENFNLSVDAFEEITKYTSCEFSVRPFILNYPNRMMEKMLVWSTHVDHNVRRLSSEGCRPRLPLAPALPAFKENPAKIIPILENLKNDESDFVRRSVANNLNDISKDNPAVVLDLVRSWKGKGKNADWVVKHGSRTLLKAGNSEVMEIFGFGSVENIVVREFNVLSPHVKVGGDLQFTFQLVNANNSASRIRLEYGVYYQKANGSLSKKVFKISEKVHPENSTTTINRKQSFRTMTTRKLHAGRHQLSLIVNGRELEKVDFELTA